MMHPIDVNEVAEVLLADGWHKIVTGSFSVGVYEYIEWESPFAPEGQDAAVLHAIGDNGICPAGFVCRESWGRNGPSYITGPLTSILGVRYIGKPQPPAAPARARERWGFWVVDDDPLTLIHTGSGHSILVDGTEDRTPADALSWVTETASTTWATDADIANLVRALIDNDLLGKGTP